jgi:hypothetical protein
MWHNPLGMCKGMGARSGCVQLPTEQALKQFITQQFAVYCMHLLPAFLPLFLLNSTRRKYYSPHAPNKR